MKFLLFLTDNMLQETKRKETGYLHSDFLAGEERRQAMDTMHALRRIALRIMLIYI